MIWDARKLGCTPWELLAQPVFWRMMLRIEEKMMDPVYAPDPEGPKGLGRA